jgi:hypothetical protein
LDFPLFFYVCTPSAPSASRSAAGAGPSPWPLPYPRPRSAPACPLPTRHPTPGRRRSLSSLSGPARATASPGHLPAATASSPKKAQHGALTFCLSRATAPHQPLHPISPDFLSILEHLTHIPPPPFFSRSGNTRHCRGQPPPGIFCPNQPPCKLSRCSLILVDPLLPSNYSRSFISDKRRRRRLRPHRGQPNPSIPTPPRRPSQHHIITPELYDYFVESLVPCNVLPTLASIHPRRRRRCPRRLPLIRRIHCQLFASTASPRPAEASAPPLHRRRSPEPCRRQ